MSNTTCWKSHIVAHIILIDLRLIFFLYLTVFCSTCCFIFLVCCTSSKIYMFYNMVIGRYVSALLLTSFQGKIAYKMLPCSLTKYPLFSNSMSLSMAYVDLSDVYSDWLNNVCSERHGLLNVQYMFTARFLLIF